MAIEPRPERRPGAARRRQPRARRAAAAAKRICGVAALALALALPVDAARAHPHVYIDGGVDFVLDGQGRLTGLRVTWIYDPLTSLFMLEEVGVGASGPDALSRDERARLAAYQTEWIEGFDGDSYLYDDGRVSIRFTRAVATPFRPGDATVVAVYDPAYFTAYAVTETPRIDGPAGCAARVEPFDPSGPILALQRSLASLGVDEDPADPVGALFADRVHLKCD